MRERSIASARQLGAAIHDARRTAGLTQAELATQAGVSREWLIGIEQGARPRAELGKILDVLKVLGLSIHLQATSPHLENPARFTTTVTRQALENMRSTLDPTTMTRQALENMRSTLDPTTMTRQALENMRSTLDPTTMTRQALENMRSTLDPTTMTRQALENMRSTLDPTTMTRQALENMRSSRKETPEQEKNE